MSDISPSRTFVDNSAPQVNAAWFNAMDRLMFDLLSGPESVAEVRSALALQALALLATVGTSDIDDAAVTLAKIADIAQNRLLGRVTAGSGAPEELTVAQVLTLLGVEAGANNYSHPNHTGHVTSTGDGATVIQAGVITNAMKANMAAWTLRARNNAGAGDPEDVALGAITENATPALTDFLLGFLSTGEIRKYPVGAMGEPDYESPDQTPASGTTITVAHGLGVIPSRVLPVLKCTTGELGFAAGDEIWGADSGVTRGWQVAADATNLYFTFNSAGPLRVLRRDATVGAETGITEANWRGRALCWK